MPKSKSVKLTFFDTSKSVSWLLPKSKLVKLTFFDTSKFVSWLLSQFKYVKLVFLDTSKLDNWLLSHSKYFKEEKALVSKSPIRFLSCQLIPINFPSNQEYSSKLERSSLILAPCFLCLVIISFNALASFLS